MSAIENKTAFSDDLSLLYHYGFQTIEFSDI